MLKIPNDRTPENVKEVLLQQNRWLAINDRNKTKILLHNKERNKKSADRSRPSDPEKANTNQSQTRVGKLQSRRLRYSKEMLSLQ